MTEYDPAVVDIYTRYKHGELNKEEATKLLRPEKGSAKVFHGSGGIVLLRAE